MNHKKIAELQQWLCDNPNHEDRTVIEADLRKLTEQEDHWPVERDTFDLREHNFHNS